MSSFLKVQAKRIMEDKWYEGCRIDKDPGPDFVINWVRRNAEWFRNEWNNPECSCKICRLWEKCGHTLKRQCNSFKPESQPFRKN